MSTDNPNPQSLKVGDVIVPIGAGWRPEMRGRSFTVDRIDERGQARFDADNMDWVADEDGLEGAWAVERIRVEAESLAALGARPGTKRREILDTATKIIHGDREQDYGCPIDSFTRLAEALNLVLRPKLREGVELDAVDAAVLMIAMKLSRLAGGDRKDDTFVDLAGYAALGAEVRDQL